MRNLSKYESPDNIFIVDNNLHRQLNELLKGPFIQVPEQIALKTRLTTPGDFQFIGGNGIMFFSKHGEIMLISGDKEFSKIANVSRIKRSFISETSNRLSPFTLRKSSSVSYQKLAVSHLIKKNKDYFCNNNTIISEPPKILQPQEQEIEMEIQHILSDIAAIKIRSEKKRNGKDGISEVGISKEAIAAIEPNQKLLLKDAFNQTLVALTKATGISSSTSRYLEEQIKTLIHMLNEERKISKFHIEGLPNSNPKEKELVSALNLRAIKIAQLKGLEKITKERVRVPKDALKKDNHQQLEHLKNYLVYDVAGIFSRYVNNKNPAKRINDTTFALIQDELVPFVIMVLEVLEK